MKNNIEKMAEHLYSGYCVFVGGKAFNGDKLPTWDELKYDSSKTLQYNAWLNVGTRALDFSHIATKKVSPLKVQMVGIANE